MKNKYLVIIAIVFFGFAVFFGNKADNANASVGMEYSYKNITSSNASSTSAVFVKSGFGTLGSIIVASSSLGWIKVYDGATATSTATLIASFPINQTAGTYTFDVAVSKGIILDVPTSHNGNYTVTFR